MKSFLLCRFSLNGEVSGKLQPSRKNSSEHFKGITATHIWMQRNKMPLMCKSIPLPSLRLLSSFYPVSFFHLLTHYILKILRKREKMRVLGSWWGRCLNCHILGKIVSWSFFILLISHLLLERNAFRVIYALMFS